MNKWKLVKTIFSGLGALAMLCIELILLYSFKSLYFQESTTMIPFEDQRNNIFYVLIALCLCSFIFALWTTLGSYKKYRQLFFTEFAFSDTILHILRFFIVLANSVFSFYLMEWMNNELITVMNQRFVVLGVAITFVIYLILVFLFSSVSVAMTFGNWLFLIWGIANYYVYKFRGIPFQWIDFGSIQTAAGVSEGYDFTPTWAIVTGVVLVMILSGIYLNLRSWHLFETVAGKMISRGVGIVLLVSFIGVTFKSDYLTDQGMELFDWAPQETYNLYGMEAGFFAFAKASYPVQPDTYSTEQVNAIIEETSQSMDGGDFETPENVIVIMDESFSDYSMYPEFSTDIDITPYLHSMIGAENTQQGSLLVSVKGGSTANSEYEFLTSNSTVMAPSSIAYNSVLRDDQYSLVSTLKSQGFTTYAMHPYFKIGYNRPAAYQKLGFDEFFSIENYFGGAETVRDYVSDKGQYNSIIQLVNEKEEGEKLFLFNITMQNHGGYNGVAIDHDVSLLGYEGEDKAIIEEYLTLIKISDSALEHLISYFSQSDQKTIIVFFGDHQPALGDEFLEYCYGKSLDDLDFTEQQLSYMTQYFIWANYDIPEQTGMTLGTNYLGSYMLSLTGLKSTGYNQFIMQQMEQIPAMNAYGYLGTDGNMYDWDGDDVGEVEADWLEKYKCLIYNELTADENRDETFFGIAS